MENKLHLPGSISDFPSSSFQVKEEPLDPEELEEKANRVRDILRKQFSQEVEEREEEVIKIQSKIQEVQRQLQILKYVSAYEYYDVNIKAEPPPENTDFAIHPCVKQLLTPLPGNAVIPKEEPTLRLPEVEQSKDPPAPENVPIVRGTYTVKHQFVIGNVSKWLPPSFRDDDASHKWMVYVRDRNKDEEIAEVVKKVRFFLHESYKPHDIVDVSCPPFHLSKRGWGEFPVRVTIFFHNPSNKPVNVIHDLKLDRANRKEQVLGSETVIEVNLIHENVNQAPIEEETCSKEEQPKVLDIISLEHAYFSVNPVEPKPVEQVKKSSNLGVSLSITTAFMYNPIVHGPIKEWYEKDILQKANAVCFLSTEACVKWFLKLWPLVTNLAHSEHYKTVHPYCFSSYQKFFSATPSKRLACEWYRCYKIKQMLIVLNLAPWTTKQISFYSKMHGYFISPSTTSFALPLKRFLDISTYTNVVNTSSDFRQLNNGFTEEEEIDILGEKDTKNRRSFSPKKIATEHVRLNSPSIKFVDVTARQLGIRLQDEVIDSIAVNASSQVLAKVFDLFLDDLVRKSYCNAWIRHNCKNPGILDVTDVVKCLLETPEFDIFTNAGLGSKTG